MYKAFLVLLIVVCISISEQCSLMKDRSMTLQEVNLLNEPSLTTLQKQQISICLKSALNKGYFTLAEQLTNLAKNQFTPEQIRIIIQDEQKKVTEFTKSLIIGSTEMAPVMKWAQNLTCVFFTFKLSHRWDSPPCLNSKKQKSVLVNNTFQFTNQCIVSRNKLFFILNLEFYKTVNHDFQIKKDGVGTYVATVNKSEPEIWSYIDKNNTRYPIWGEMIERYERDMKEYFYLVDNMTLFEEKKKKKSQ